LSDVIGLLHQAGDAIGADLGGSAEPVEAKRAPARARAETPAPVRKATVKPPADALDDDSIDLSPAKPAPSSVAEPAARTRPQGPFSGAALWGAVLEVIAAERPLSHTWARAGVFAEQSEKKLTIHFSPGDRFARDSLTRDSNRIFIEEAIRELAGRPLAFAAEVKEGMTSAPLPELEEDDPPASVAPSNSASGAKKAPAKKKPNELEVPAAEPAPAAPVEVKAADPVDPESYMNDPLIQGALDLFEAKLESSS